MRRVLIAFMGCFLLLEAWLGYWVVGRGPELAAHARNPRRIIAEMRVARGEILDRNGNALAVSEWHKNAYYRRFTGPYSAVQTIGYMHQRFGKVGLEKAYDADLRGDTVRPNNLWETLIARKVGLNVVTTIDSNIQAAAEKAMSGRRGAVVALDAKTGAILAAASVPFFDPNDMSESLFSASNEGGSLFNRALQGRYPPGSAFKPLILAAALQSKAVSEKQTFYDNGSYMVDGFEINNYEMETHGRLDLKSALAYSSNVVFVQVGLAAGGAAIRDMAQHIGMFQEPNLGVPAVASHLPSLKDLSSDRAIAQVSIGQGEAWVSPLHMAMMTATIANGGYTVQPYLVQSVGGENVVPPQTHTRVINEKVVEFVTDAMREVVRRGTGTRAAVKGATVYGKTGTADNPGGKPHAWFIGFATMKTGTIAVAAVVENAGTGGYQAAPIVAKVIAAAMQSDNSANSARSR